jgi:methyl-accepting chemotaxis protein
VEWRVAEGFWATSEVSYDQKFSRSSFALKGDREMKSKQNGHRGGTGVATLEENRLAETMAHGGAETLTEQMLEQVPVNVMRSDTDHVIRYMNTASRNTLKKIEHLLPCRVEEVVGSSVDIFHKNPSYQRKLLSDPKNLPHHANIQLGPETLSLNATALYDAQHKHVGTMVVWEVITERLQLEAQNADFAGQIAAIGRSQAIIEFKMDGTVITANENFLKALGYSLGEIQGKHHSMFVEDSYRRSAEYTEFWAKLNRGEYVADEFKRIGKGGKEVWIQASYNPILDLKGKPCKVVKYATDVTPQKLAAGKAQAVVEFKMDGTIITANENFLKTTGCNLDEIKGKNQSIFLDEGYRNSAEYKELWAKLNRGEYITGEFKRVNKAGNELWIQASYNPMLDHNGKPFKVVEYTTDITERKIVVNKVAGYLDKISKGEIPPKISETYSGDFNLMRINLNTCIDNINALVADANVLSRAAVEGKLSTRADASKHQGDFRKIVQGVDDCLDAVIGPLKVSDD